MEILGGKSPRLTIIASASLAVVCLFYVFTIGTQLQIRVYPLVDRVTYLTNFDFYIVNEFVDHVVIGSLLTLWLALSIPSRINRIMIGVFAALFIVAATTNNDPVLDGIALAAIPTIVLLIIYNQYSREILNSRRSTLTLNYLAVVGMIIGLISFTLAISSIASPTSNEAPPRSYTYEIFLLFSSVSPILILILITSFPIKMLAGFIANVFKIVNPLPVIAVKKEVVTLRSKIIYLSLFAFISIILVVIPHLPTVNTDNQLVGVDTIQYGAWMTELRKSGSTADFLFNAFIAQSKGERPISFILIYAFQQILASGNQENLLHTIEYLPLILGPALVLVMYFLTRAILQNDVISLFAAFLTAISFHILIGLYAGFYANWFALIFGYLSLAFLFRFIRTQGRWNLALYGVFLALTLLSHAYTWSIFAIVMGIFLGVSMVRRGNTNNHDHGAWNISYIKQNRNAIILFIILLSTVAIDSVRTYITGYGGISRDLQVGSNLAGPEQFVLRWNNLTHTSTVYVGGLFANFIILGLGIYWLITSRMKEDHNILLVIFFSVGILAFLFGEWVIQTRIFYNIPFQIPAALAMYDILRRTNSGLVRLTPIYLWLVSISILLVANFYLILPS